MYIKHIFERNFNPKYVHNIFSFVKNYRLSKEGFLYLLNQISSDMDNRRRQNAVPKMIKLSATLKFLATGGYQNQIGGDKNAGLAQQTMSKILTEVLACIERVMCPLLITFEMQDEEKNNSKRYFWQKSHIPGVIGVVDGTHIQLIRPTTSEHLFFNRKLKHSINAMLVSQYSVYNRTYSNFFF